MIRDCGVVGIVSGILSLALLITRASCMGAKQTVINAFKNNTVPFHMRISLFHGEGRGVLGTMEIGIWGNVRSKFP